MFHAMVTVNLLEVQLLMINNGEEIQTLLHHSFQDSRNPLIF